MNGLQWRLHMLQTGGPLFRNEGVVTEVAELPDRAQIADEYKWNLDDIYKTHQDWNKDIELLRKWVAEVTSFQGHVGESASKLLEVIQLMDKINELFGRIYVYAQMNLDVDNANSEAQSLQQRAVALSTDVYSQMAFFEPELLSLPEETVTQYVSQEPDLGLYQFYLSEIMRQKPHILSIPEEQLLAQASEILNAPKQIFHMFNDADLRFPTVKDDEGRDVELTHGRFGLLLESRNRDVRRGAFEALYTEFEKHKNMLAATYSTMVKRDVFTAKARHYNSSRQMYMFSDNVPESVYDSLIDAVHESLPALQKYMKLRERVLNLPELHVYDLYVPIVADVDKTIPYEEAVQTVLASLTPLGEEYINVARAGLESGWVDVYENRGKRSGAYAWGTYGVHPFILLNHQGTFDNMFTLAHELGHAMHTHYSQANQPHIYSDYTIFVAEVASTLNENLLMHHLLQTTQDKQTKAYIVNHHLETIRTTLIRQTLFAEFEKRTHEHMESGEPLTLEWLNDTHMALNKAYYGNGCVVDQQIALEWARIPHFYTPFYVYKYATGISAATALSQRILQNGASAAEDYLGFLKGGSSKYPIELLRGAGVDMESPEPVKSTLSLFANLVDELSALLD